MDQEESLLRAVREHIELCEWSSEWSKLFRAEQQRLKSQFSERLLSIEHVGSTAVSGLAAKPIVDILAAVASVQVADQLLPELSAFGYETSAEFNASLKSSRWLMRHAEGRRTHHLHLVVLDSPEWVDKLRFRNALRSDAALAERYVRLKQTLVAAHPNDREAYTDAKREFVRAALEGAPPLIKTAIIHGTKGSPAGNWFPWLRDELSRKGSVVFVPHMPTPEGHTLENWISAFSSQVGSLNENTVLIGHSAGALLVWRLLERSSTSIRAAVSVAGFIRMIGIPEYDELNQSFFAGSFDWPLIRSNARHHLSFAGENDPYVPAAQTAELSTALGIREHVVPSGGHLNAEFGYRCLPVLLEALEELNIFKA